MYRLRQSRAEHGEPHSKRQCLAQRAVPTVLAPDRVLRYLAVSFGCTADRFYHGMSLQRPTNLMPHLASAFPRDGWSPAIVRLDSVRVDHCAHSFGFVLGIYHPLISSTFLFCYSGDTRPCATLVQACNFHAKLHNKRSVDFLLHEATFHHDDRLMCIQKKHSTGREALAVARDVRATRTMLTHFSQRYDGPPSKETITENESQIPSFDGLRIQLI